MERVITILAIYSAQFVAQCFPINNGFTVKFWPEYVNEENAPKQYGARFAKIPQGKPQGEVKGDALLNAYIPFAAELGTGCTNQIARIIFPTRFTEKEHSDTPDDSNFINLPIFSQPYTNYKILVATAPPNVKLSGDDARHMVVYLVFPEDDTDNKTINLPTIYFVNKLDANLDVNRNKTLDPIFIIDSNRTVTGLKSREIAKHVRFTSPMRRRYNYRLT